MENRTRKILALTIIVSMLLVGCTGEPSADSDEKGADEIEQPTNPTDNSTEVPDDEIIEIGGSEFCDDTNHIHCMLPFPSGAFLDVDETRDTGYSLSIDGEAIPDTRSSVSDNMVILDRLDGFSPSTQIFTAFDEVPNITGMATQFDIGISTMDGHSSILLNLDTGEKVHHWIELDARAQEDEETIIFLRTIEGLDHNTPYAVGFRNLVDEQGTSIVPSDGFKALRDGYETDSDRIEGQREPYEEVFNKLEDAGFERSSLQSAWWFHTASTKSILEDILIMRDDAEQRLGGDGIGCQITEVEEDFGNDGTSLRLVRGTITTPHYMENEFARSPLMRGPGGDPEFVENREIDFTMLIPKSLAENNTSGPLTVFGHGLFGDGDSYAMNARSVANEYQTVVIATDFKGWSSDGDLDAMTFALMDLKEFQYQQERQMQAVVNHISMVRTITGICSDIEHFKHNGTNMIDVETVNYIGISLGGLRGPSLLAFVPELDWGVLWVGGTSFTHQVERSTHYGSDEHPGQFFELLSSDVSLPSRLDRAVCIALLQSIWDSTDGETYLPFRETGYDDVLEPFDMFYLTSMMDAQVTTLSADRAVRTGNVPVVNGSAYHPFGVDVVEGPIEGSSAAYFDGDFPPLPTGNTNGPMWHHSLAHNLVLEVPEAKMMAYGYLISGVLVDYCDPKCTFEGDW
ncbi:MAG: hypothetical protein VX708_00125 [Candidatus Thermoplasmatota archaeon]|nr:hypothetical protein [Candidatus Thermoplasmatota archaeon]